MLEYSHLQNCPVNSRGQVITVHDKGFISTGQIVQLINPDESQNDELYVLMAEEDNPGIFLSPLKLH